MISGGATDFYEMLGKGEIRAFRRLKTAFICTCNAYQLRALSRAYCFPLQSTVHLQSLQCVLRTPVIESIEFLRNSSETVANAAISRHGFSAKMDEHRGQDWRYSGLFLVKPCRKVHTNSPTAASKQLTAQRCSANCSERVNI